jgi:hypothetical protein
MHQDTLCECSLTATGPAPLTDLVIDFSVSKKYTHHIKRSQEDDHRLFLYDTPSEVGVVHPMLGLISLYLLLLAHPHQSFPYSSHEMSLRDLKYSTLRTTCSGMVHKSHICLQSWRKIFPEASSDSPRFFWQRPCQVEHLWVLCNCQGLEFIEWENKTKS